jgi:hypothetical protein
LSFLEGLKPLPKDTQGGEARAMRWNQFLTLERQGVGDSQNGLSALDADQANTRVATGAVVPGYTSGAGKFLFFLVFLRSAKF